jgi:hypothetical protein
LKNIKRNFCTDPCTHLNGIFSAWLRFKRLEIHKVFLRLLTLPDKKSAVDLSALFSAELP